ncbi:hypothetical protein TNCV_535021 [Trichonephila clavipes]|nr:hypothetical protein TNCV_535021 [Trichonephila clavipes]
MDNVNFLHRENPSTWARDGPATEGVEALRQTNYAAQTTRKHFPNCWERTLELGGQRFGPFFRDCPRRQKETH